MNISLKGLEIYDDVLNTKEVAEYLKISTDTVRKLVDMELLKCVRIGKMYRFTKQHIIDFLEMTNRNN